MDRRDLAATWAPTLDPTVAATTPIAYDADELPAGMVRLNAQLDEVMALLRDLAAKAQPSDSEPT